MPSSHGRQKKLAKQKKKRELAKKSKAPRPALSVADRVIRMAAALPYGPAYISAGWKSEDGALPELVTVIVTRRAPDGELLPGIALVDRTCLGVKNAFVSEPVNESMISLILGPIEQAHGGVEIVDVPTALSIVYHAIDYARALGFEPHEDFPGPLFGPRPEPLLDTPLAKRARPFYVPGPDDDMRAVFEQLVRKVGVGNFDLPPREAIVEMEARRARLAAGEDEDDEQDEDE